MTRDHDPRDDDKPRYSRNDLRAAIDEAIIRTIEKYIEGEPGFELAAKVHRARERREAEKPSPLN